MGPVSGDDHAWGEARSLACARVRVRVRSRVCVRVHVYVLVRVRAATRQARMVHVEGSINIAKPILHPTQSPKGAQVSNIR